MTKKDMVKTIKEEVELSYKLWIMTDEDDPKRKQYMQVNWCLRFKTLKL